MEQKAACFGIPAKDRAGTNLRFQMETPSRKTEKPFAWRKAFMWRVRNVDLNGTLLGPGELIDAILQNRHLDTSELDASLWRRLAGFLHGGVAHAKLVNPINRNTMIQHQVTHHRVGHLLRVLNGGFAAARRESLDLDNEASLGLQLGGNLVKRIFVALAERKLAGTETQFELIGRLSIGRGCRRPARLSADACWPAGPSYSACWARLPASRAC